MAVTEGKVDDLVVLLKEDITLYADGGGSFTVVNGQRLSAALKSILGKDHVSRLILSVVPKFYEGLPDINQEIVIVNGLPSVISYSGNAAVSLVSIEPEDGKIKNIYVQTNPEKLKRFKK